MDFMKSFVLYNDDAIRNGVDWLYTTVDNVLFYDYKITYLSIATTYFDEHFNYFFKIYWFFANELNDFQLFYSVYLDKHFQSLLYQFPFLNEWAKNVLIGQNMTMLQIYHPEIFHINDSLLINFGIDFGGYIFGNLTHLLTNETIIIGFFFFLQIIIITFFLFLGILLYFSFFTSSTKEENLIDQDYMLANITIEAEEEIASMDDIVMLFTILFYVFGWYFFTNFWVMATKMPEFVLLIYLFPFLYYVIILIPTFLLFDFGIYFIAYLKGVASAPVFILEFVFDLVAVMAFYIRILVQAVRLLLMVFTYASLHDFILFYSFDQRLWTGNESILDEWNNMWTNNGSFSYFFFFTILSRLYYWLYELLHTFFVLTAQFTAFFAMVFWLFFFLYTFFVFEKQEAYFAEKRSFFQKNIKYKSII